MSGCDALKAITGAGVRTSPESLLFRRLGRLLDEAGMGYEVVDDPDVLAAFMNDAEAIAKQSTAIGQRRL